MGAYNFNSNTTTTNPNYGNYQTGYKQPNPTMNSGSKDSYGMGGGSYFGSVGDDPFADIE